MDSGIQTAVSSSCTTCGESVFLFQRVFTGFFANPLQPQHIEKVPCTKSTCYHFRLLATKGRVLKEGGAFQTEIEESHYHELGQLFFWEYCLLAGELHGKHAPSLSLENPV